MKYQIINGNNIDVLKTFPDNHFDSIVTDPPYLIDFLGKSWDANNYDMTETFRECLRVLKPGGHILAFSAARTYHKMAVMIENAGFEIRDQLMWIYSSGFPKSQDIGKSIQRSLGVKEKKKLTSNGPANGLSRMTFNQSDPAKYEETKDTETVVCTDPEAIQWQGWGTQLKPAHEPIALARKPIKLSIAKNCQTHGVGALNIDATRIGDEIITSVIKTNEDNSIHHRDKGQSTPKVIATNDNIGRFPSNVLGEIPDYQKYFYCPKVSRRERHAGFDDAKGMFEIARDEGYTTQWDDKVKGHIVLDADGNKVPDSLLNSLVEKKSGGNNHPTVKPIELMKYLIKLITPPNGKVLDPFNGSGSTGCAAVELGCEYVGIELDANYVEIAKKRIEAWNKQDTAFNEIFE